MGANQSTSGSAPAANDVAVKTSYYEVLGIERTATDDEIKKAYRRKALELHPDRNYGDVERATALFAEVQSAYEVLSDPQERSWYDSHEASILRGDAGNDGDHYEYNMKVTTADDISRMMGKFRSNVEFSDAPNGFFGFVRETFEQLKKEEEYAADVQGVDCHLYPSFGHAEDTYEDVVRDFYNQWSGFATVKSFAWMDKYRASDADNRWVRRQIEKENQRMRETGIREFNEAVRALLLFVRKRDPRYTPNTQTAAEREKIQRDLAKKQAARAKAARAAQTAQMEEHAIPEWATRRDPDEVEEESEEDTDEEIFECVACNKNFKSERQWEAHEKSKKHQKAMAALKRKMRKENAHLDLDEDIPSSGAFTPMDDDLSEEEDASMGDLAEKVDDLKVGGDVTDGEITDDEKAATAEEQTKPEPAKEQPPTPSESSPEPSDDEYAPRSEVESRIASSLPTAPTETSTPEPDAESTTGTSTPKLGKAAQKRLKRAAQQAELEKSGLQHQCTICKTAFPSKTKLFQHIKDEGHAALKSDIKAGKAVDDDDDWGSGKKKKGKKGKR